MRTPCHPSTASQRGRSDADTNRHRHTACDTDRNGRGAALYREGGMSCGHQCCIEARAKLEKRLEAAEKEIADMKGKVAMLYRRAGWAANVAAVFGRKKR